MAATFVERVCRFGDWENDGGSLRPDVIARALTLFAAGVVDANYVKTYVVDDGESALTVGQQSDVDDLLSTLPGLILNLVGAVDKALWASRIEYILQAGMDRKSGFTTAAMVNTALGV
jgi:hypothetical protein